VLLKKELFKSGYGAHAGVHVCEAFVYAADNLALAEAETSALYWAVGADSVGVVDMSGKVLPCAGEAGEDGVFGVDGEHLEIGDGRLFVCALGERAE
jgi:hypothetical protein